MRVRLPHFLYYFASGKSDQYGHPSISDPVLLPCRWEDSIEETIGPDGDTTLSNAVAYLLTYTEVGGIAIRAPDNEAEAQAGLATLPTDRTYDTLKADLDAKEIITRAGTPSLKGDQQLFKIYLR